MKVRKKRYYVSLNYLRALAFIGVSLFHRFGFIVKGGYLGVLIFLVLSGFLTSMVDYRKTYKLDLSIKKLINKFINLIGPVLFIIGSSLIFALIFAREIFDDSIKSALPVALNFENIRRIVIKEDYFNQLGNFNITTHLWYVSLFVQILVVYMLINHLISKRSDKFKLSLWTGISFISFIILLSQAKSNEDITRIYYGLDTRISTFSIGCALFYISKLDFKTGLSKKSRDIIILILSLLVIVPFFIIDGTKVSSYRGFFIIYTILVGLLVLFLYNYENPNLRSRRKESIFGKIFSYIGDRSYYLYLWQYVVQIFMVYFKPSIGNKIIAFLLELILLFILSEMTYILFKNINIKLSLIIVSAILIIGLRIVSLAIGNDKSEEIDDLRSEISQNQAELKKRNEKALAEHKAQTDEDQTDIDNTDIIKDKDEKEYPKTESLDKIFEEKSYDDFNFTGNELAYLADKKIVAVGDSVIINADSYIRKYIPSFFLDGEVGRDMPGGARALAGLIGSVGESDIYVVALGSNGSANPLDMDAIMAETGDADVYFVTTSHTQSYMDYVNDSIEEYTKTHDRAHLIDWRSYIKDKPEYLAADRTHPNVEGSDAYAKLIMRAILNVNQVAS